MRRDLLIELLKDGRSVANCIAEEQGDTLSAASITDRLVHTCQRILCQDPHSFDPDHSLKPVAALFSSGGIPWNHVGINKEDKDLFRSGSDSGVVYIDVGTQEIDFTAALEVGTSASNLPDASIALGAIPFDAFGYVRCVIEANPDGFTDQDGIVYHMMK